ncbi:hypothetical protein GO613_14730 [Azoarcus communis]|uniref:Uncharacterized protein n=1 Tax=Parazoarcus communis SWub3 = DSM 12120 TaxID=1121029 RepID=A0A323UY46_9RHOO|nr:hypothetical protein [Parazoarcus communis]NMG49350.1 hypothetical protein [Parazoarcus communis]NMG69428.1 hypothetical protein [Parazoarcus communis SWub3 = DSM 12120]PZA17374.1 hypothetical protein DNK49_05790 [Azoarcus communis] [Parazoarcus communis SWub3 = DSM 12120]
MILQSYEEKGLLFNSNFTESAGAPDLFAYRGDLVLVEGEIGDSSGRRKPPVATIRQSVLLAKGDKLTLAAGLFDDIARLPLFVERYAADLAPDAKVLFFVNNIGKPLSLTLDGVRYALLPLEDGMVWNELLEELAIEKSDLKGQSAGEKVATVCSAMKDYKFKGDEATLEVALASTIEVKRSGRGPV